MAKNDWFSKPPPPPIRSIFSSPTTTRGQNSEIQQPKRPDLNNHSGSDAWLPAGINKNGSRTPK